MKTHSCLWIRRQYQDRTKTIKTLRRKYRSDSLWLALEEINEKWLLMGQETIFKMLKWSKIYCGDGYSSLSIEFYGMSQWH